MKAKRSFADIAAARKTYNPEAEGYGDVRQWRGHFYQRMGWEEARRVIEQQERTPRQILAVGPTATWAEIKTAFRRAALDSHPDRAAMNGMTVEAAEELFKKISAAYAVLEHEFGK